MFLPHYLSTPFINGLCHVIARMTLPRSEYHVLWNLARHGLKFQRGSDDFGGALSLTPCLKDLAPNWSGYNDLFNGNKSLLDFFEVCPVLLHYTLIRSCF